MVKVRSMDAAGEALFAAVYATEFPVLVRLAYVTTGNRATAEDLVQDAFVELYRHWPQVLVPGPWLRRAVLNRCTSWVRHRSVERRHAHRAAGWAEPAPRGVLGPDGVAVRAALARLNSRQRAALFLRFYLDLPEVEIAEALGCRPGTVKSLLHRGMSVMKEHLDVR